MFERPTYLIATFKPAETPKTIKYYNFTRKDGEIKGTCYDGVREFISKSRDGRLYPDEYLIADILEKYVHQHSNHEGALWKNPQKCRG